MPIQFSNQRGDGDMKKDDYDPNKDGVIALAETEAQGDMTKAVYDPNEDGLVIPIQLSAECGDTSSFNPTDPTGAVGYGKITNSIPAYFTFLCVNIKTAAGNGRIAIYSNVDDSPALLKAQSASVALQTGWNTISLVTPVILPAGDYWLAFQVDNASVVYYKKTVTSGVAKIEVRGYGEFSAVATASAWTTEINMKT